MGVISETDWTKPSQSAQEEANLLISKLKDAITSYQNHGHIFGCKHDCPHQRNLSYTLKKNQVSTTSCIWPYVIENKSDLEFCNNWYTTELVMTTHTKQVKYFKNDTPVKKELPAVQLYHQ